MDQNVRGRYGCSWLYHFAVLSGAKSGRTGSMLDERSEKISRELSEASALRDAALEELKTIGAFTVRRRKKSKTFCNLLRRPRNASENSEQKYCRGQAS